MAVSWCIIALACISGRLMAQDEVIVAPIERAAAADAGDSAFPAVTSSLKWKGALALGTVKLTTSESKEVDKSGSLLTVNFGGTYDWQSLLLSGAIGYLGTQVRGSGELIDGDQTAWVATPTLELSAGYQLSPMFSGSLGVVSWVAKGSNFAPEDSKKGNQLFYFVRLGIQPEQVAPLGFNLQYQRDSNNTTHDVTAYLFGIDYQLAL